MRYKWLFLVTLLLGTWDVSGLAVYDLEVDATLFPVGGAVEFPPAYDAPPGGPRNKVPIINRLGWAQPAGDLDVFTFGDGDFLATATAAETKPKPGFPLEGPDGTLGVAGWADSPPNSFSLADASVNDMTLRFSNRGGVDLWIDWELKVSWDVMVSVDDSIQEYAHAGFFVDVAGAGVNTSISRFWTANDADAGMDSVILSFRIPRYTVSTVIMNMWAFGYAESTFLPATAATAAATSSTAATA